MKTVQSLMETKTLIETLDALTSGFSLVKFVEVEKVEGIEFDVPYYKDNYWFKDKFYTFRLTDKKVPENRLINPLRVRLYHDEGCVAVYELTAGPLIYLVEIWKDRGKRTDLEMVKLHYYSFGDEKPKEEPLGYVRVGSYSIIGLMAEKQACELIELLVKKGWRVGL
jgi:hypothetical protein